uniref:C2H2-type domain-containing protein n=1 Tax=Eutreptiella gymnastica TaxID=73025 RepID=A0A7S4GFR7_9EUGL
MENNITVQRLLNSTTKVVVTSNVQEIEQWITENVSEAEGVVGCSLLWDQDDVDGEVFTTNHQISLFQIALRGECLLARVHDLEEMPPKLRELIEDSNIIKAMCGFNATYLRKLRERGFTLCHYMDLGDMERKLNKEAAKKDLSTLAEERFSLPFGESMVSSCWSAATLSEAQINFAASLALVCIHVYWANEQRVQRMVRRLALPCSEPDCQRYFSSQKSLDHHKQVAHDYPAPLDPNAHQCPRCIKHFRSPTALVQHIEVSHPEYLLPRPDTTDGLTHTFFCGECDASFHTREDLESHQKLVGHKAEKYVCEICAKTFTHRSALDMHYDVTHGNTSGDAVHLCAVCNRCFSTLDALYQHQQCVGHSLNEICNVCAASFMSREALEEHYAETGHNNFYLCGSCPKKFADKDALSKHEHSTGHEGGGRACDMPPFPVRRAALANMRRNAADAARRTGKRKDGYEKNQKEPNMKNANGQTRERNLRAFGVAQNGQADQQQPNPVMQQQNFSNFMTPAHDGLHLNQDVFMHQNSQNMQMPEMHMVQNSVNAHHHTPNMNAGHNMKGIGVADFANMSNMVPQTQTTFRPNTYQGNLNQGLSGQAAQQPYFLGNMGADNNSNSSSSLMYSHVLPNPVSQYYYTPDGVPQMNNGSMNPNVGPGPIPPPPPGLPPAYPQQALNTQPQPQQQQPPYGGFPGLQGSNHHNSTMPYSVQPRNGSQGYGVNQTANKGKPPSLNPTNPMHQPPAGDPMRPETPAEAPASSAANVTLTLTPASNTPSKAVQPTPVATTGTGLLRKPATNTAFKPPNGAGTSTIPSITSSSPTSSPSSQSRCTDASEKKAGDNWHVLRPQAGYPSQPGAQPRIPQQNKQASPQQHFQQQQQNSFVSLTNLYPTAQPPPPANPPPSYGPPPMGSPCPSPSLQGYSTQSLSYNRSSGPATPQSHLPHNDRRPSHSTPTSQSYLSKSPSREEFFHQASPGNYISHPLEQPSPFPFNRQWQHATQQSAPSSPARHSHSHRNAPSTPPTQYPPPTPPPHQPPSPSPQSVPAHPPSPHQNLGNVPPGASHSNYGFSYGPQSTSAAHHDHSPSPELPPLGTPEHQHGASHASIPNSPYQNCIQGWNSATEPYETSSPPPHPPFYHDLCSPSALVQPYLSSSYGPLSTPPKKPATSPPETPPDMAPASSGSTPSNRCITRTPDGNTSHNPYGQ